MVCVKMLERQDAQPMANSDNTVTIRDERGRYLKGISGGPGRPMGSRDKLSQDFLADLQEDWEQHGRDILEVMREKHPEIYFQSMVKLAMIHRIELGQPQAFEQRRTREEVLQKMEERAGPVGRKMLEKFLVKLDKLERGTGQAHSVTRNEIDAKSCVARNGLEPKNNRN
jgi:hypothetical protein